MDDDTPLMCEKTVFVAVLLLFQGQRYLVDALVGGVVSRPSSSHRPGYHSLVGGFFFETLGHD